MKSIIVVMLASIISAQLNAQKLSSNVHYDLNTPEVKNNLWKSNAGLWRLWNGEQYLIVDPSGKVILELGDFKSVSDFKQGYAVVETPSGKYGAINRKGHLAIDTSYYGLKNAQLGYFHVAKETGHYIRENRGDGEKLYPVLSWRLLDVNQKPIPLAFSGLTQINATVTADLFSGERLSINLRKINHGYYHPLMEAIEKVDGKEVRREFDIPKRKINYLSTDSGELMLSLPFYKNPEKTRT